MNARLSSLLVVVALIGCSGNDKQSGVSGAKLPGGSRSAALEHEACDEAGNRVDAVDVHNDNKHDIKRVYDKKSGKEICRIVDLNRDGKPDLYEYFDGGNSVRRREFCYGDDGVVNAIEYYEGGRMVRREYDTSGQRRIDTWDFFDPTKPDDPKTKRPKPVKRERDTNGDGVVDQWWTWEGEKLTILMDKNLDGKPDPDGTLVMGDNDAGAQPVAVPEAAAPAPKVDEPIIMTVPDAGAGDGGKK